MVKEWRASTLAFASVGSRIVLVCSFNLSSISVSRSSRLRLPAGLYDVLGPTMLLCSIFATGDRRQDVKHAKIQWCLKMGWTDGTTRSTSIQHDAVVTGKSARLRESRNLRLVSSLPSHLCTTLLIVG